MLKKVAYVVVTSGLFLAPLGASAMVTDSPFPVCVGADCASTAHDDAQKYSAAASGSAKIAGASNIVRAEQTRAGVSPFPADNSKD